MDKQTNPSVSAATHVSNPLLAKWAGPFGGIPPFDKVSVADFKPALEEAMDQNLGEVLLISANRAAPTFENTIAELERSGQTLKRVRNIYGIWSGNMSGSEFRVVEREMAPKLASLSDKITQNEALFKRIEAVYNSPEKPS